MGLTAILPTRTISPIGLDLGASAARAAQLRRTVDGWSVQRLVRWPVRRPVDADNADGDASPSLVQATQALATALRRSLRQRELTGRNLVAGLSQPDLELHTLELPPSTEGGPPDQAEAAARWEIERLSLFEEGTTETALWWLPRPPRGGGAVPTAMGVSAPRTIVTDVSNLCRATGAVCSQIDAAACGLSRAAAVLRPPSVNEIWGILDLGARATRLILCVDDVPVLARSFDGGGQGWTQQVAQALGVSPEAAERHKCDHGITFNATGRKSGQAADDRQQANDAHDAPLAELANMVLSALTTDLGRITAEIVRSYEYVLECYRGRQAGDLVLAGGGAALKNLDGYLAGRLGITVRRASTYFREFATKLRLTPVVDGPARTHDPVDAYLGAIGLAITPEAKP